MGALFHSRARTRTPHTHTHIHAHAHAHTRTRTRVHAHAHAHAHAHNTVLLATRLCLPGNPFSLKTLASSSSAKDRVLPALL